MSCEKRGNCKFFLSHCCKREFDKIMWKFMFTLRIGKEKSEKSSVDVGEIRIGFISVHSPSP